MGTEVEAFLGPLEALRGWKNQLQSAVVFRLNSSLGLVPSTGALLQELRVHFQVPTEPDNQVAERWGCQASEGCTIAYFTAFEFGDEGEEHAVVWTGQKVMRRLGTVAGALELLGADAGSVGIDRYRKTHTWAAAAVLQDFDNRGVAGLIEALRHPSADVRQLAAGELCRDPQQAESAIPRLAEVAKGDPVYGVRLGATQALGALGECAVPALQALLASGELKDRWGAIFALGGIGPAASPAIPDLVGILKTEPDYRQRQAVAETLGKIGPAAAVAIPVLLAAALGDQNQFVRYHSVVALGAMGRLASQAVPALRQALADPYREVYWVTIVSLQQIGPFPLQYVMAALRTHASWVVRSAAAKMLGTAGSDAWPAIPALIDALRDEDNSVRTSVAEALGLLGAAAKEAIPALVKALETSHRPTRRAAMQSIRLIHGAAV